jgi:LAS seventeen-binding protein 1/2
MAQQAQDPNHPAHPQNPKHHEWVKSMATKFGNAAMFGAGATFGGDMVNDVLKQF